TAHRHAGSAYLSLPRAHALDRSGALAQRPPRRHPAWFGIREIPHDPRTRGIDRIQQAETRQMKFARSLLFACWLYGLLTVVGFWFLPYAMVTGPKGAALAHRVWTRASLWGLSWMVGARVVIEGRENLVKGPALYAAKHQAMLDVLVPSQFLDNAAYVYKI